MVIAVYTVKDLSEILNLTERQIYDRLKELDDLFKARLQRGKNNRVLVDDGGLEILRRLTDLESEGLALKEAANRIRQELSGADHNGNKATLKEEVSPRILDVYERQIAFLKEQIAQKDKQIEALQDILRSRLPGSVEAEEGGGEFNIAYLQRTIANQREEIERLRRMLEEKKPWWQRWFRSN